ncbi:cation:proton antiporter domain-containing protein, partial [Nitratifractor sp.]
MADNVTLILSLSLLLWVSPYIGRMLRTPTPPVEIVAGSLLAAAGLLHESVYFDLIAQTGFLYLMFLAGLEVDLKEILGQSRNFIRKALLFVLTLGGLALVAGWLLGLGPIEIVSLPLISIGLVASLSKLYGKQEAWLRLAITVGVLGEMASIAALTILDAASTVGFGWELAIKLGLLGLFLLGIYLAYRALLILFWWYPEIRRILIPRADTSEQDVRL